MGPDGAGKTTLLRILVGLLDFEASTAIVLEYDIRTQTQAFRRSLGYVPQTFSLYPDLTVQHTLEFFADVHGLSRAVFRARMAELLALAQLERFSTFSVGSLSGGMKQKLALICALLHQPRLLILDEPNNGVDVIARGDMWTILRQLQSVTIVMSTGYLDEAERCDELIYLYKGQHSCPRLTCRRSKPNFPWHAYRLHGDLAARYHHTATTGPVGTARASDSGHSFDDDISCPAQTTRALHGLSSQEIRIEAVFRP